MDPPLGTLARLEREKVEREEGVGHQRAKEGEGVPAPRLVSYKFIRRRQMTHLASSTSTCCRSSLRIVTNHFCLAPKSKSTVVGVE